MTTEKKKRPRKTRLVLANSEIDLRDVLEILITDTRIGENECFVRVPIHLYDKDGHKLNSNSGIPQIAA